MGYYCLNGTNLCMHVLSEYRYLYTYVPYVPNYIHNTNTYRTIGMVGNLSVGGLFYNSERNVVS